MDAVGLTKGQQRSQADTIDSYFRRQQMYTIQKSKIGQIDVFQLYFEGFIKLEEMSNWVVDSKKELQNSPSTFAVFVDMRGLRPLPADAQSKMQEEQKLYKQKGMVRSAVLVPNGLIKLQFERIAKESGIHEWERYFSVEEPDWKVSMNAWLEKGAYQA